ncbi:DUF1345 domain-containing protein [Corynebacterium epidermidicanis]|uniref:Putative membrane protein n=1 Tax=Corynebacterium epidermidicanis TaxID=1050174 RepID=A0A0G3GMC6_9CORY|nr:DUF1345 domain-containing protein [Corynebacterium epidermidicanis]AKK02386.1 putative membrane protein [Corynebacterium epidermidicanis]
MKRIHSGWNRMLYAFALGAVAATLGSFMSIPIAILLAITVTTGSFVISGWAATWPLDARGTQRHVSQEDYSPLIDELVVLATVAASVVCIVVLQLGKQQLPLLDSGLTILAVSLSWACVHFMYAVRYAHAYYQRDGGIDFNSPESPQFSDFLYFSYNLGMTYQVSDTSVSSPQLRAIILRHCLLAYGFGVFILATAVNLTVGLISA